MSHAAFDLLHNQMFVDDTVFLTMCENDIQTQLDKFNLFAAVWGSVLNISKTMLLSNTPVSNVDKWLESLQMDDAPCNVARYLGMWISLKNSSWNQHFNKTISKAKSAFFYLHAKGLKPGHINAQEAINLFKILIIPKLTFGAEVILPSDGAIKKVNAFLGFATSLILGIPLSVPPCTVLWEADIPDFKLQLEVARLRFHRKMLVDTSTV